MLNKIVITSGMNTLEEFIIYNKRIVLNAVHQQLCYSAAQVLTKQPTSQNKARICMNCNTYYLLQIIFSFNYRKKCCSFVG